MAEPQPGWTLSAALSPATEHEPAAPDDDISLNARRDWAKASGEVRTTVKWLISALAAVGAMLFAKGIVSTPALSWTQDRAQLVWALVCGVLALLGIGSLITMAVRLLRPTMYGLLDLPADFRSLVEKHPGEYLPSGVRTMTDFERQYRRAQRAVFASEQIIKELTIAADSQAAGPPAGSAAGSSAETLKKAKASRAVLVHNWAVFRQAKESLLERAEYHTQISGLSRLRLLALVAAGVLAATGGIGYVLALSTPAEDASSTSTPARPVIGELVRNDTPAGQQLWNALRLSDCQATPGTPRVAVVIASGTGSTNDPFSVTTLPTATCRAVTFPVINEVATVVRPAGLTVTYTPAPSPSPSRLTPNGQPSLRPSASPG